MILFSLNEIGVYSWSPGRKPHRSDTHQGSVHLPFPAHKRAADSTDFLQPPGGAPALPLEPQNFAPAAPCHLVSRMAHGTLINTYGTCLCRPQLILLLGWCAGLTLPLWKLLPHLGPLGCGSRTGPGLEGLTVWLGGRKAPRIPSQTLGFHRLTCQMCATKEPSVVCEKGKCTSHTHTPRCTLEVLRREKSASAL